MAQVPDEEYLAAVLELVELVPPGRATTYGALAEVVAQRLGRGGPRQVGAVLAHAGGDVPWWRVVTATGEPPRHHRRAALDALRAEACPLTADGQRVALRTAFWWPQDPDPDPAADPELTPGSGAS